MTVDPRLYWSIEDCGWRLGPRVDALATPWSGHEVGLPRVAPPADAYAVLRTARPDVPQQRDVTDVPAEAVPPAVEAPPLV